MSEENQVSNETVVEQDTKSVAQEPAQNEYIAESKKYRKRAQEAETELANVKKQIAKNEELALKDTPSDFLWFSDQAVSNAVNIPTIYAYCAIPDEAK